MKKEDNKIQEFIIAALHLQVLLTIVDELTRFKSQQKPLYLEKKPKESAAEYINRYDTFFKNKIKRKSAEEEKVEREKEEKRRSRSGIVLFHHLSYDYSNINFHKKKNPIIDFYHPIYRPKFSNSQSPITHITNSKDTIDNGPVEENTFTFTTTTVPIVERGFNTFLNDVVENSTRQFLNQVLDIETTDSDCDYDYDEDYMDNPNNVDKIDQIVKKTPHEIWVLILQNSSFIDDAVRDEFMKKPNNNTDVTDLVLELIDLCDRIIIDKCLSLIINENNPYTPLDDVVPIAIASYLNCARVIFDSAIRIYENDDNIRRDLKRKWKQFVKQIDAATINKKSLYYNLFSRNVSKNQLVLYTNLPRDLVKLIKEYDYLEYNEVVFRIVKYPQIDNEEMKVFTRTKTKTNFLYFDKKMKKTKSTNVDADENQIKLKNKYKRIKITT